MKTQISRNFIRTGQKNHTGVYQQQGRMLLDSDANEQTRLITQLLSRAVDYLAGHDGTPDWNGVKISDDFEVSPSWFNVAGLFFLFSKQKYGAQKDFPAAPGTPSEGDQLYLDCWERPVVSLEDPTLLDPALHGADTCTRTQMLLQLKRAPSGVDHRSPAVNPVVGDAPLTLSRRESHTPSSSDAFRTTGNYLFRLEVHDVKGLPSAPTEFTVKWSSENGAEAYANGSVPTGLDGSDWLFEFYNDKTERHLGVHLVAGGPEEEFPARGRLFKGPLTSALRPDAGKYPYVRRWDGFCSLTRGSDGKWRLKEGWDRGVLLSEASGAGVHGHLHFDTDKGLVSINLWELKLELGLKGATSAPSTFVAGDYWMAAVREPYGTTLLDAALPTGIIHRHVHLGQVKGGKFVDESAKIPSLWELTQSGGASRLGAQPHPFVSGTTIQAQLTELLNQLQGIRNPSHDSGKGTSLIGGSSISANGQTLSAGSLRDQLTQLLTMVSEGGGALSGFAASIRNESHDATKGPALIGSAGLTEGGKSLSAGTLRSQLGQLLTILGQHQGQLGDLTNSSQELGKGSALIGSAGLSANGKTLTAGSLQDQITQLLTMLGQMANFIDRIQLRDADYGSALLGSGGLSANGKTLPAGSLRYQLSQLLAMLGEHLNPSSTEHDGRYTKHRSLIAFPASRDEYQRFPLGFSTPYPYQVPPGTEPSFSSEAEVDAFYTSLGFIINVVSISNETPNFRTIANNSWHVVGEIVANRVDWYIWILGIEHVAAKYLVTIISK